MKSAMRLMILAILMIGGLGQESWGQTANGGDAILGRWDAQEKTLTIEVYKQGQEYRARIISFTDHHSDIPSAERTDEHNPNAAMRSRKLIGIDVLSGLHYNTAKSEWADGHIYDVSSGSSYSASASLDNGTLTVRAFKGLSIIGKTLHFRRGS